jgi:hypothetical protein
MVKNVKMHKAYRVARIKPEAVILGTSRSAFGIDPEHEAWGSEKSVYNLALAGAGPYVTERFLEHAQSVNPLKKVVYGLDFFTFNVKRPITPDYNGDFLLVDDEGKSNQLFLLKIISASLLSIDALSASTSTVTSTGKKPIMINGNGMFIGETWKNHLHDAFVNMEELYLKYVYFSGKKREYAFADADSGKSSLEEFRKLVIFCRDNGIDAYYFISPPHAQQLEVIRALELWPLFEQWKREISSILEQEGISNPLWDFSGYNSVTMDDISQPGDHYYRDSTHYNSTAGDLILSRIFRFRDQEVPDDFGIALHPGNIEEHLESIRNEQKKYHELYPDKVLEIEQMAQQAGVDEKDIVIRLSSSDSRARWFRSQYRDSPVSKALRDYESGLSLEVIYKKYGITGDTISTWKKKYDKNMSTKLQRKYCGTGLAPDSTANKNTSAC